MYERFRLPVAYHCWRGMADERLTVHEHRKELQAHNMIPGPCPLNYAFHLMPQHEKKYIFCLLHLLLGSANKQIPADVRIPKEITLAHNRIKNPPIFPMLPLHV